MSAEIKIAYQDGSTEASIVEPGEVAGIPYVDEHDQVPGVKVERGLLIACDLDDSGVILVDWPEPIAGLSPAGIFLNFWRHRLEPENPQRELSHPEIYFEVLRDDEGLMRVLVTHSQDHELY